MNDVELISGTLEISSASSSFLDYNYGSIIYVQLFTLFINVIVVILCMMQAKYQLMVNSLIFIYETEQEHGEIDFANYLTKKFQEAYPDIYIGCLRCFCETVQLVHLPDVKVA